MPLRGDRYAAAPACYNGPPMTDAAPPTIPAPPKGALAVVLLIVFIDLLGFGIILPQLPFYAIHFHASPLAVAMLFSIYSACQFAAAPILGVISDRVGRKPVLAFSQLGSALGYLLLGVTTQLHFDNVTMALGLVYLARVIDGVTGGNISTAQAYISDVTTPATRARGMGLFGAMFGIGFAVGPVLGLVGNDTNRAAWPAYLAAGLSLTAAVLSVLRLPESRAAAPVSDEVWLHPGRLLPLFRRPTLGPLLLVTFATMAAFTMLEGTIGLFLHDRFRRGADGQPFGMHELSWYFAYIGVIITVVQGGVVGRAIGRFGEWPVGIVGAAAVAVAMSLYVGGRVPPGAAAAAGRRGGQRRRPQPAGAADLVADQQGERPGRAGDRVRRLPRPGQPGPRGRPGRGRGGLRPRQRRRPVRHRRHHDGPGHRLAGRPVADPPGRGRAARVRAGPDRPGGRPGGEAEVEVAQVPS